jgi:hypothetical protein
MVIKTPSLTLTPTPIKIPTPTTDIFYLTPTNSPTSPNPTPTNTFTPTPTSTPTPTPTPTPYPPPTLTAPENGASFAGKIVTLSWEWSGELKEDEFFEVRVWAENLPYHAALGWVKVSQFDYNVSGRGGKYFWTVVIVKDRKENIRTKDWYKPEHGSYPVYEHIPGTSTDSIQILSPESEPRFFFFTSNTPYLTSPADTPPSNP